MKTIANLLELDYRKEADLLKKHPFSISDVHTHVTGRKAALVYKQVAELFGVRTTYSMTPYEDAAAVKAVMGDAIRFIAIPDFHAADKVHAFTEGYLSRLDQFAEIGVKIAKFWAAPRGRDFGRMAGDPGLLLLNAPHRVKAMQHAVDLGMILMTHVGDPSTWFATKYSDSSVYGTREAQYEPLEELLAQFRVPWILAHMGGWPEDLEFLSALLERHPNAYLDSSATKWMVRELSRHTRADLLYFLNRWKGRILFGSDIVTSDSDTEGTGDFHKPAAFDLYASRYWALRTLFETDYSGNSPIADPDLELAEPEKFTADDSPILKGKNLPDDILRSLYFEAAADLLDSYYAKTSE